jgi:enoyl-CoA hydratase/carnithine racemase
MGVETQAAGPAALVILDWPEKRNALGPEQAGELAAALRTAAADPGVRGVVITGNGAFCAGGDIKGMVARADMPAEERRALVYSAYQGLIRAVLELPVPTVAAVDGPAVGMGFDLALACDSRFIGPEGWCRQGWARLGLIPGTGGELLLRTRAPGALWQLLDGQPKVSADVAERLGIGEGTGERTAREAALQRVESYAAYSRAVLAGYVRLNRSELRARLADHQADCLAVQLELLADPEFRNRAGGVLAQDPVAASPSP